MKVDNNHLRLLRIIAANPEISQRMFASQRGASLDKTYPVLRALLENILVTAEAVRRHRNKFACLYLAGPRNVAEMLRLARAYLAIKECECKNIRI